MNVRKTQSKTKGQTYEQKEMTTTKTKEIPIQRHKMLKKIYTECSEYYQCWSSTTSSSNTQNLKK